MFFIGGLSNLKRVNYWAFFINFRNKNKVIDLIDNMIKN